MKSESQVEIQNTEIPDVRFQQSPLKGAYLLSPIVEPMCNISEGARFTLGIHKNLH